MRYVLLFIFIAHIYGATHHKNGNNDCNAVNVQEVGECSDRQINYLINATMVACLKYPDDVLAFLSFYQHSIDKEGYSALASYDSSGLGYTFCLDKSNLCYVLSSISSYQLIGTFVGGPCNSSKRIKF
jgi:hypothetical protein